MTSEASEAEALASDPAKAPALLSARGLSIDGWRRCGKPNPCPACGSTKQDCAVAADGNVCKCMREAAGAYKTKTDAAGRSYHLHRLRPEAAAVPPPAANPAAAPALADEATRDDVYRAMLEAFPLARRHGEPLVARGLPPDEARRGYGSLPPTNGRADKMAALAKMFGDRLAGVPGFVRDNSGCGGGWRLHAAPGLLVPVRDLAGGVVGMRLRADQPGEGGKYRWLSGGGGAKAPALCHWPAGCREAAAAAGSVRVTEGELKADVAQRLDGSATFSVPGASAWPAALAPLAELQAAGVKEVVLAFDADAWTNPQVGGPLKAFAAELRRRGFAVALARWAEGPKGIDDALQAGVAVEVLRGDEAAAVAIASAAGPEPKPAKPAILPPAAVAGETAAIVEGLADAAAFWADPARLERLADLKAASPGGYEAAVAALAGLGVAKGSLRSAVAATHAARKASAREQRQEAARSPVCSRYEVVGGALCRWVRRGDEERAEPLVDGVLEVVGETIRDPGDGSPADREFALRFAHVNGWTRTASLPAADFPDLPRHLPKLFGPSAACRPGAGGELAYAVGSRADGVPARRVVGHSGWAKTPGGTDAYLFHGGAIGPAGLVDGLAGDLPGGLARLALPAPPDAAGLREAAAAALALPSAERLGPRLGWLAVAAAVRPLFGDVRAVVHLAGSTGSGKTTLSLLIQAFFGAGFAREKTPPASWRGTSNYLPDVAWTAKDAPLVVDDAKAGSAAEQEKLFGAMDAVARDAGNGSGRGRLRRDLRQAATKYPRGLIVSTGEIDPRAESARARLLLVPMAKGELRLGDGAARHAGVDAAYADAAAGRFAAFTAGMVQWLAADLAGRRQAWRAEADRLEALARPWIGVDQGRAAPTIAEFGAAVRLALRFLAEAGALASVEADAQFAAAWRELVALAAAQSAEARQANPAARLVEAIGQALGCGLGHLTSKKGTAPDDPAAAGWASDGQVWRPRGLAIGAVLGGGEVVLYPETALSLAKKLLADGGGEAPGTTREACRLLREAGLLLRYDAERKECPRATVAGRTFYAWLLRAETLFGLPASEPASPSEPAASAEPASPSEPAASADLFQIIPAAPAFAPAPALAPAPAVALPEEWAADAAWVAPARTPAPAPPTLAADEAERLFGRPPRLPARPAPPPLGELFPPPSPKPPPIVGPTSRRKLGRDRPPPAIAPAAVGDGGAA